jgi:hypothetical protein
MQTVLHDWLLGESILIERSDVCVVFVCWLRLDFVPLCVVLGALGSLRLLYIHTHRSVCYPRPR